MQLMSLTSLIMVNALLLNNISLFFGRKCHTKSVEKLITTNWIDTQSKQ